MRTSRVPKARRASVVVALCLAVFGSIFAAQAEVVTGDYIVVFNESAIDPAVIADQHAALFGADISFVYSAALKGYAATIPTSLVGAIEADPRVAFVELDGPVQAMAQVLPWGIDKIEADLSSTKAGDGTGAITNVNVYIIDTGIDTGHPDLNVVNHVSMVKGPNKDCNGHGTHVAGTASARDDAADVVGAAPGAALTGVKVLNCAGSGTISGVIAGVDWVTTNAVKPAVANMSLGGSANDALDTAVKNSAAAGIFYAVAAGNDGKDACLYSPARAGAGTNNGIMTVAATDSADGEASFSNFGPCVDVWAPGVSILSTKSGGGTTTLSGTSMSSPHGAGGGALYLSGKPADPPATVEAAIKTAAKLTGTKSKDGRDIIREDVSTF